MDARTILRSDSAEAAAGSAALTPERRMRMRRIGVRRLEEMPGVLYLGSEYGGYAVPAELVRGRTGLSFGAGEDISFEVGLARELGATVHIYGPHTQGHRVLRGGSLRRHRWRRGGTAVPPSLRRVVGVQDREILRAFRPPPM